MELIARVVLAGVFLIFSQPASALFVQSLNVDVDANKKVQYLEVRNTTSTQKVYTLSMVQVDVPKRSGSEKQINDGALLYSPQRLVLNSGDKSGFKFFYEGELDKKERYFRIKLVEMPLGADTLSNNKNTLHYDYRTAIELIMVVRPAVGYFHYTLSDSEIKNTGNTYFKYMSSKGCDNRYAQSRFIPPGESLSLMDERQEANRVIIYGNKIIALSQCAAK